ncbi:MAG: hypothetical protein IJS09_09335 [Treponema sp.]|nr:hypothetical protein [Treponema sp.]
MINPKYIGIAAGVGFVLSFLIGIFSGISFGLLLLRALICAAIFAAVGTGGSILYQKFLSDEQFDSGSDAPVEKVSRPGGVVDITIGDESLPEDSDGPRFDVSGTRSSLRAAGLASAGIRQSAPPPPPITPVAPSVEVQPPVQETVQEVVPQNATPVHEAPVSAGFQPVSLVAATTTSEQQAPVAEPVPVTAPAKSSDSGANRVATSAPTGGPADDLPDIGAFALDSEEEAAEGEEDVVNDSEFATEDEPRPSRSSSSKSTPATEQSASVMAQAIRTILAKN